VLTDRHTALQQLKKLPGSRLKMFTSRDDAVSFSKHPESACVTVCPKSSGTEVKVGVPEAGFLAVLRVGKTHFL